MKPKTMRSVLDSPDVSRWGIPWRWFLVLGKPSAFDGLWKVVGNHHVFSAGFWKLSCFF